MARTKNGGIKVKATAQGAPANGMQTYASETKVSKDSPKIAFTFSAPATLADAAKSEKSDFWHAVMLYGLQKLGAQKVRAENDTTILVKGSRVDALTVAPRKLARFLSNVYDAAYNKVKRDSAGKMLSEPKIPAKVAAIASKAVSAGLVKRSEEDGIPVFDAAK